MRAVRDEKEQAEEREHEEFAERSAVLLQRIHDQETEIIEESRELDKRTIKLADGRKVYIDGDTYRDDRGRELDSHSRAEAEQLHLDHPDAATWQEKREIDRQWQETERLKRKAEQASENGDQKVLSATEKEVQTAVTARVNSKTPDYSSGDDITGAFGLSEDFGRAVNPTSADRPGSATPLPAPARPATFAPQ